MTASNLLEQPCNRSDNAKLQVVNSLFQACYNNWEQAVRTQLDIILDIKLEGQFFKAGFALAKPRLKFNLLFQFIYTSAHLIISKLILISEEIFPNL